MCVPLSLPAACAARIATIVPGGVRSTYTPASLYARVHASPRSWRTLCGLVQQCADERQHQRACRARCRLASVRPRRIQHNTSTHHGTAAAVLAANIGQGRAADASDGSELHADTGPSEMHTSAARAGRAGATARQRALAATCAQMPPRFTQRSSRCSLSRPAAPGRGDVTHAQRPSSAATSAASAGCPSAAAQPSVRARPRGARRRRGGAGQPAQPPQPPREARDPSRRRNACHGAEVEGTAAPSGGARPSSDARSTAQRRPRDGLHALVRARVFRTMSLVVFCPSIANGQE